MLTTFEQFYEVLFQSDHKNGWNRFWHFIGVHGSFLFTPLFLLLCAAIGHNCCEGNSVFSDEDKEYGCKGVWWAFRSNYHFVWNVYCGKESIFPQNKNKKLVTNDHNTL